MSLSRLVPPLPNLRACPFLTWQLKAQDPSLLCYLRTQGRITSGRFLQGLAIIIRLYLHLARHIDSLTADACVPYRILQKARQADTKAYSYT